MARSRQAHDAQLKKSMETKRKTMKVMRNDELSPQEREWKISYAIWLKASDYSYNYISDAVNVARVIVKSWFDDPKVVQRVVDVQADIVAGTLKRAKDVMGEMWELLCDFARYETDPKLRLTAILETLDRGGLTKVNKSERVVTDNKGAGLIIDTEAVEKLESLPLETQEKLAKLGEEFSQVLAQGKK